MIFIQKKLVIIGLLLTNLNFFYAIDVKTALIGTLAYVAQTDARKYQIRNASPDKTMVVHYTCTDHTKSSSMIAPIENMVSSWLRVSSKKPSKPLATEIVYALTLFPGDRTTISKCDRIDSLKASVQTGQYPFNYDAPGYYDATPTDRTLYTYRTFKITTGDCKKHHWCDTYGYDATSIFSRDRGIRSGEFGWMNSIDDVYEKANQDSID